MIKNDDIKLVAGFLDDNLDRFAEWLEGQHQIDGSTEAGVIIGNLQVKSRDDGERLCPHDDVHDRIRNTFGYVRDGQDQNRSVCALCWLENARTGSNQFHSPHGYVVTHLFSMLVIGYQKEVNCGTE